MEQLTQMELSHLEELISMEALAVKKYQLYRQQCKDQELTPFLDEAVTQHQTRVDELINQMRKHNGRTSAH